MPLVISINLAQIPTITPKVDLLSSIEREREHPKLQAKHTTHTIILRETLQRGSAHVGAVAMAGGQMRACDVGDGFSTSFRSRLGVDRWLIC